MRQGGGGSKRSSTFSRRHGGPVAFRTIFIATAARNGERNCFHLPNRNEGKFRGEISLGNFAGKSRGVSSREKIARKKSRGKIAEKNRGEKSREKIAEKFRGEISREKSRGKSNHIWAAGPPGAWAHDPN